MKHIPAFLLLLGVPLVTGCATAVMSGAANGDRAETVMAVDARLVRDIRTLIYRDSVLGDDRIRVSSRQGVVTLSGVVDDRLHIDRAMDLVRSVEGVRGVNIELRVGN